MNPAVDDWEERARRRRAEHRAQADASGVSNETVAKRFGATLGKRSRLGTVADPAVEHYGSTEKEGPRRFAEIRDDLTREGVRIVVSSRELESIGYSPARNGDPSTATLHATEGMNLSAWKHEYAHFCFDRDHGYPGLGAYCRDPSLREESERTAYGVEIEMAKEKGE